MYLRNNSFSSHKHFSSSLCVQNFRFKLLAGQNIFKQVHRHSLVLYSGQIPLFSCLIVHFISLNSYLYLVVRWCRH